jgi:CAAX protease family protein
MKVVKHSNTGWQRVISIIISFIFIVGTFQFIGLLIAEVDYKDHSQIKTSEQDLIIAFFALLGTFFLLWLFMKYVDKEKFINLGFHIKNRFKEFNYGIAIGALIMIIGYLLLIFIDQIIFKKLIFNPKEIIISILIYSIVAIAEEVIFRGYILRNLMISFNKYVALIISSLLFSVMHGFNPNIDLFSFFNLFLAGILLGISYVYTKNLWFPIALHFSWNFFQTLLGFNVSGQNAYSIINFTIPEKNILNGGDFGFEGSILSIISQIIFIVLILIYYNNNLKSEKI